jgi:hypothetical protein
VLRRKFLLDDIISRWLEMNLKIKEFFRDKEGCEKRTGESGSA